MLLSVSYLSTINMNFIILFFLEHFQYIIYFHSRYTSQYTVPYNSLAVHNVFLSTSCTYPVQTARNHIACTGPWVNTCWLSQATRTSLSSKQLENRLHWQSQTLSKAVQRWKEKRKLIHQDTHELILYQPYILQWISSSSHTTTNCTILKGNGIQLGSSGQAQRTTNVLDSQFLVKTKAPPVCTYCCRVWNTDERVKALGHILTDSFGQRSMHYLN